MFWNSEDLQYFQKVRGINLFQDFGYALCEKHGLYLGQCGACGQDTARTSRYPYLKPSKLR